jgi:hypothetical protein
MPSLSFATDVRPLFRDMDIQSMQSISGFDLSRYEDVRNHAQAIYDVVASGSMPCDEPWSAEYIAKFKAWVDGGMAP